MAKTKALTPERRKELLTEAFELHEKLEELELAYEADADDEDDPTAQQLDEAIERLGEIQGEYLAGLPTVAVSRCPFCDQKLLYPIDNLGLQGLWWDGEHPIRPDAQLLDPHFLALTGAVDLGQAAEEPPAAAEFAPFRVEPGPEAPFVVPRLFENENVQAVVSTIKVGNHTAYPVVYYADPLPLDALRVNTWGSEWYEYRTPEGELKWGQANDSEQDYDFDLEPWIAKERVKWIAPDDEALILHGEAEECPYLGLKGRREVLCIQAGLVWGLSDLVPRTKDAEADEP